MDSRSGESETQPDLDNPAPWRGNHRIWTPSGYRPKRHAGQASVHTQLRTHVLSQCLRGHGDDPGYSPGASTFRGLFEPLGKIEGLIEGRIEDAPLVDARGGPGEAGVTKSGS
jgi:hypothetical protein